MSKNPASEPSCPDFDFVGYRLYDAVEWSIEYETARPLEIIGLDVESLAVEVDVGGDETFNYVFFRFLRRVLEKALRAGGIESTGIRPVRLGAQLLDRAFEAARSAYGPTVAWGDA